MMKHPHGILTRIAALVLALLVTAGMTSGAFAETPIPGSSVSFYVYLVMDKDTDVPTVSIPITVFPGDDIPVKQGRDPEILPGPSLENNVPPADFVPSMPTYTSPQGTDVLTLGENEKYAKKEVTLDLSVVNFSKPGVYRYRILQNTSSPVTGVSYDTKTVRYLDVFVATDGTALSLQGTVLHQTDDSKNGGVYTAKDTGFANRYTAPHGSLTITAAVSGNHIIEQDFDHMFTLNAWIKHETPGTEISISGTLNQKPEFATSDPPSNPFSIKSDNDVVTVYLKANESITFEGLSPAAEVELFSDLNSEQNYEVIYTLDGQPLSGNSFFMGSQNHEIKLDHRRQITVPTGIALDVAPYLWLAALAGVTLLLLAKHRRRKAETR